MPALSVRQVADLLPAADFTAQDIRCVACPVHINLKMEFVLVLAGEVVTCIRGAAHRLHAGEAAFILPFETHDFASQGDSRCIVLAFSQRLLPALQESFATRARAAASLGVTDKKLSRVFHREAGVCFSDYLALRRLSEAGNLLRAGGRTAAEIAFAVGFRSVRTFNRAFRKHYGVTPTAFAAAPAAALPFNALRGGNRA